MTAFDKPYDADDFIGMFKFTLRIVDFRRDRPWHAALQHRYSVHPAVYDAMKHVRPYDWHQLLLEYPHRSETDPYRIAYTRDERAGEADRQTITTIGKYLTRHFPTLSDHHIRDIVALYTSPSSFKILDAVADFVHAVNNGPNSCMCWREDRGVRCRDGQYRHPYEVYHPKYGWRMAIRTDGGQINGRALLQISDEDAPYFVRSFKRSDSGGYSHSDEQLEAWLKDQGYEHRGDWDGAFLAYIPTCDEFLAPYIDGDAQYVDITTRYGEKVLCIQTNGEYECDNTDGTPSGGSRERCECCDNYFHEDDMTWVGRSEDTHVCQGCLEDEYTYAYSRYGHEYYIHNDDVVYVQSQGAYYDVDYLTVNNIVELYDGEFEHTDYAVYVDSRNEWYPSDDECIVSDHNDESQHVDDCVLLENGEYALTEEAFYCEGSSEWYLKDDFDPVIVDGKTYHPEHAPATEQSTETGE